MSPSPRQLLIPIIAIPLLILLPFIDRNPEVLPRKRPVAILLGVLVLIATVVFTVWGLVS